MSSIHAESRRVERIAVDKLIHHAETGVDPVKSKHTPWPWIQNGNSGWSDACKDRGNIFECKLRTGTHVPDDQNEANTEFIVRAVNCHEELLEFAHRVIEQSKRGDMAGLASVAHELVAKAEGRTA